MSAQVYKIVYEYNQHDMSFKNLIPICFVNLEEVLIINITPVNLNRSRAVNARLNVLVRVSKEKSMRI